MAVPSDSQKQRRAPRFAVTPRGMILNGANSLRVIVQDVSDSGLSLICSKEFATGTLLDLKLQLSPSTEIECTVEVRHSSDVGTGTRIVSMDEANRRIYERYLQEFFSQQLGRSG
jgi:PilZ domain